MDEGLKHRDKAARRRSAASLAPDGVEPPGAERPVRTAAAMALAHRYRFVAPLAAARVVRDVDGAAEHHAALGASHLLAAGDRGAAHVLLALDPRPAGDALERLPAWFTALAPDGVLAFAVPDWPDAALRAALGERFAAIESYRQRPVFGSIVAAEAFAGSRVAMLADAPAGAADGGCAIIVCGAAPLDLAGGLFEIDLPLDAPVPRPSRGVSAPGYLPSAPHAAAAREPVARADAVSLVERLIELDQRAFSLATEARVLRDRLAQAPAGSAPAEANGMVPASPPPQPPLSWPLLENPEMPPGDLGLYERRPDDDLVAAARQSEHFFAAYDLLGEAPKFAAAAAALNKVPRRLALAAPEDREPPEVSIVIPVYGQLAYTLNCLDGLLRHASARRVEIIVADDHSPDATVRHLAKIKGLVLHSMARNSGFIATCNEAAALARGRFLVLLNNDTRVLPGWLDAIIDSFALFPRAGLVGAKLLYPDGTLQEAGGIVWRDGNAWNYGRGDDPNRPYYCHARQADYVSGASIALPMDLWRTLGGFDTLYAPAYYEDTDIAFRVREAGRQVWVQPLARVVHYEGRTSGTDLASGAKAYQVVNHGKFYYRWRETLLHHSDDRRTLLVERERQVARRALLLDDTTPTPRQDAGSNYTLLTMRLFQALGYKLGFVPQDNFLFQREHTEALHRIGIECAYAPYHLDAGVFLQRYGGLFDVIMVSRLQVLEKVIGALESFAPRAPVLFNTHDLNFLRMRRAAEVSGDASLLAAAEAMRERELTLMRRTDCVVTPSYYEGEILARELPDVPTRVLPIMTDLEGTDVGFEARRDVCFLGGYRHPPNIDAVRFFLDRIFPLLKAADPAMRFIMAGANPSAELQALASDDVVVTGMVEDLRDVFDRVRVFVCPLRVGAGAKGKVASALSYGVPVVATSIGAEGMGLVEGETVLVADEPAAFAAAVLRVYRDRALWERMSAASLALVARVASPAERERVFADAIDAALRHKLGLPI